MTFKPKKTIPAHGWMILHNTQSQVIQLLVEPYGLIYNLAPGDQFYIHLSDEEQYVPILEHKGSLVKLFADSAIVFHQGLEVHNYTDINVEAPIEKASPNA